MDSVRRRLNLDVPEREEGEQPATAKQLAYIRRLAPGIKLEHGRLEDLGKWQASALIDQLKEEKGRFTGGVKQKIWERKERKLRRKKLTITELIVGLVFLIVALLVAYHQIQKKIRIVIGSVFDF